MDDVGDIKKLCNKTDRQTNIAAFQEDDIWTGFSIKETEETDDKTGEEFEKSENVTKNNVLYGNVEVCKVVAKMPTSVAMEFARWNAAGFDVRRNTEFSGETSDISEVSKIGPKLNLRTRTEV